MHNSIEISILIHATENKQKVLGALVGFLELPQESIQIKSVKTEGHWRNPIDRLIISVNNDVDRIFDRLCGRLSKTYDDHYVINYIKTNTDAKGHIYIRLDKQNLCNGEIMLSDKDSVRIIFKKLGVFESRNKKNENDRNR